ncbi:membrane-bound lytic murein transglycosylase MltF [Shewanella sp. 202IG2-18]|uniref:membrane-bound lytic murein transglycosylase MltF n=1 Tax=Parashewanella hymeniacidonis TaxID=2807618 RepID=UPI00195F9922|nr:membrane-bound lytic murein transglycosylase MltF [Parashewanella hymeniacidonis]MBM7072731.1 membrane-bound lytic murein transglycosylase MltF [Parashewanella hymeniacidonis]
MKLTLCSAWMILILSGCRATVEPSVIPENPESMRVLRVGTLYGAHTYMQTNNGATGFDYEMALKFAQYLKIPLKVEVYSDRTRLYRALNNGKIDIIAAGQQETPSRERKYRSSPPLYFVNQVLVYRKGTKKVTSLKNIVEPIDVMANSSFEEQLKQLSSNYPNLKWKKLFGMDNEELLDMINQGEIVYTVADSNIIKVNQRFMPEITKGLTIAEHQPIVWFFKKHHSNRLFSKILDFWNTQIKSATFKFMCEKYFGHVKNFDYVDAKAFIKAFNRVLPRYRPIFKKHAKELDWRKLAAASYQESHWKPKARSFTGVRGMMMLTNQTAKHVGIDNRLDAEQSIKGGAIYLREMIEKLPDAIPERQRMWFALASYNIGIGHVLDAQKLAKQIDLNPNTWRDMKKVLPLLQQRKYYQKTKYGYGRGTQAVHYVDSIRRYYDTLVWLDEKSQHQQVKEQLLAKNNVTGIENMK